MSGQGSRDVDPPLPCRRDQKRTEQHDVRRPERCENSVRQRADQKSNFGAEVIGDRDNEGIADSAPAAKARSALRKRSHGCVWRDLIHPSSIRRRGTLSIASVVWLNEAVPHFMKMRGS